MQTEKLKSSDPNYFKIYQRELYKNKLGHKCKCDVCGSIVSLKYMSRHKKLEKCSANLLTGEARCSEILKELVKLVKEKEVTISVHDLSELFEVQKS
jgi:hypothetical protein